MKAATDRFACVRCVLDDEYVGFVTWFRVVTEV